MTRQQPIGSGFGHHSTAAEVIAGIDLGGRRAVVTGGYSGIGLETTCALVGAGAEVIVPARRPEVATAALDGIDRVTVVGMDLADRAAVTRVGAEIAADGRPVDLIIGNAGIMAVPFSLVDGVESHFATNLLGHYLLINALWPAVPDGARVVLLSSAAHFYSPVRFDDLNFDAGYDKWQAYGQSKTADVLAAVHLDRQAAGRGIHAFAVNPGGILTPLQRHMSKQEMLDRGWIDENGNQALDAFKTPEQGAATTVWAATAAALADHGGTYLNDCEVAAPVITDDVVANPDAPGVRDRSGVRDYAIDPEQAERLWRLAADLTGVGAIR